MKRLGNLNGPTAFVLVVVFLVVVFLFRPDAAAWIAELLERFQDRAVDALDGD